MDGIRPLSKTGDSKDSPIPHQHWQLFLNWFAISPLTRLNCNDCLNICVSSHPTGTIVEHGDKNAADSFWKITAMMNWFKFWKRTDPFPGAPVSSGVFSLKSTKNYAYPNDMPCPMAVTKKPWSIPGIKKRVSGRRNSPGTSIGPS